MTTDPIADMLIRIKNASLANHDEVYSPYSKLKERLAKILKHTGFIKEARIITNGGKKLKIILSYKKDGQPAISQIVRVSKPGKKVYVGKRNIPFILGGLGIAIISTPLGLMTDSQARKKGVGGEVICKIW